MGTEELIVDGSSFTPLEGTKVRSRTLLVGVRIVIFPLEETAIDIQGLIDELRMNGVTEIVPVVSPDERVSRRPVLRTNISVVLRTTRTIVSFVVGVDFQGVIGTLGLSIAVDGYVDPFTASLHISLVTVKVGKLIDKVLIRQPVIGLPELKGLCFLVIKSLRETQERYRRTFLVRFSQISKTKGNIYATTSL